MEITYFHLVPCGTSRSILSSPEEELFHVERTDFAKAITALAK
jgi:hypothetical protein